MSMYLDIFLHILFILYLIFLSELEKNVETYPPAVSDLLETMDLQQLQKQFYQTKAINIQNSSP